MSENPGIKEITAIAVNSVLTVKGPRRKGKTRTAKTWIDSIHTREIIPGFDQPGMNFALSRQ
jgi:hypothetical protein